MRRGARNCAVSTGSVHTCKMADRRCCSETVFIACLSSSSTREAAVVVMLWDGGVIKAGGESLRSIILYEVVEGESLWARSHPTLSGSLRHGPIDGDDLRAALFGKISASVNGADLRAALEASCLLGPL